LAANNFLTTVGETKGALVRTNLTATTDLRTLAGFQELVVRREGDTLVRLSEIADVELGAESYDEAVRFSGQRAVFMGVWVRPNANALEVIADVRDELDALGGELPTGMQSTIAYDATRYIEDAIDEISTTLFETILIV